MAVSRFGFQVDNLLFPLTRQRLNEILLALSTLNFSSSDPPVMQPYMLQLAEVGGKLKARVRNATNTGWLYDVFGGGAAPPGSGLDYFGATLPSGWLWRDGQKYASSAYPDLYAAIGTTFNTGGELAGEFRVPDDRKRMNIGSGSGFALGGKGGAVDVPITKDNLPNYSLSINQNNHSHPVVTGSGTGGTKTGLVVYSEFTALTDRGLTDSTTAPFSVSLGGSGQQLQTISPYFVCNKIIKF